MITISPLFALAIKVVGLTAIAAFLFSTNIAVGTTTQPGGKQQVTSDGGLFAVLNGDSFTMGETITVIGTVEEHTIDSYVAIEVIDPRSRIVETGSIPVTADNTFIYSFEAGGKEEESEFNEPMTTTGNYRMVISYFTPDFDREAVEFVFYFDAGTATTAVSAPTLEEGIVKTTSKGTLDIRLKAIWSDEGRQASFQVSFLNPDTHTLHEHQDYDFRILKNGQEVYSAAEETGHTVLHNVEGTLIIPYTFRESGDYTIQVYLAGIGLPAIPTNEDATFPITITEEEFPSSATAAGGNTTVRRTEINAATSNNATTGADTINRIIILAGAAVQGSPDYDPDSAQVPAGNTIVWDNQDTVPHTSTSGTGPQDPNSAQLFDTGIINGGEESTPVELQGVSEGQTIPYYCIIHPYMTAELTITAAEEGRAEQQQGGGGEQTGAGGGGGAAPGAGGAGGPTLTILEGSSIQGSPDYDPDELTVAAGSEVTVINDDTLPHTVTSGTGPTDPNSAQSFDTSLINGGESATLSLAQVSAGQYRYYCLVHPYMTGALTIVPAKLTNQTGETAASRLDDMPEPIMPTIQPPPSERPQEANTSGLVSQSQQLLLQEQRSQAGTAAIASISFGSSTLTTDAYQPNPIQISVGETVRWVNDDSLPHIITSGENATPDGNFDSGIMAPGATFEHTFPEAGDYPYFCLLHTNMVGNVSVG